MVQLWVICPNVYFLRKNNVYLIGYDHIIWVGDIVYLLHDRKMYIKDIRTQWVDGAEFSLQNKYYVRLN